MKLRWTAAAILAVAASFGTANAAEFYRGKDITYIVATSPGGGYDTYARLIARFMEKHLGASRIVVRNVPGAGHLVGANTLWASDPDGLTIGTFNTGLIYAQILQREGVQFDLRQMSWIGKAAADPRALVVSAETDFDSIEALIAAGTPAKFATAGIGSASFADTQLIAAALDLPVDIITGFNGNEGELAMLRGEIAAQVGSTSSLQPFVDNGYGSFVLAIGGDADGVPQAADLATTDKGRSIVNLVQAMSLLGRLTAAPPGVPADRLDELRAGYAAAISDPELLAEAERLGIPIDPAIGDDVAAMVSAALDQSPETVAIIAAALEVEIPTLTVRTSLSGVSPDGKVIEFRAGQDTISAKVSGSRTAITVNGAEADRKALVAGMICEIEYDPAHEENEPKMLACEG